MFKIAQATAIFSALFTTIALKGLHWFHFIDWKPTAFLKMIPEPFFRYVALFLIIYLIVWILFLVACPFRYIALCAFLAAFFVTIIVECVMMQKNIAWENISISFFVLTIVNCRFIMETASFHFWNSRTKS